MIKFKQLYDETESLEDSKQLQNICLIVGGLYHFKVGQFAVPAVLQRNLYQEIKIPS